MKKIVANIICFIILLMITTNVQASSKINANISNQVNELKAGQETTITLKFNDYQEISKGINAYKATLVYDKTIFEEVVVDNFKQQNQWEEFQYNRETGEFVAIKKTGSKTPEEVVQIKLKVKEDAKPGKTDVKIIDIVTSEGKQDIPIGEIEESIDIIREQTETKPGETEKPGTKPGETEKPENPGTKPGETEKPENPETNPGEPEKPITKPNGENNTENAPEEFPKTGKSYIGMFILIAIQILIVIAIIIKRKEKKLKNGKMFISIVVVGFLSIQIIGTISLAISDFVTKGELNEDGEINYSDVNLLELHLVHLKSLPDDKLEKADMNNDGKLTVTDLTLLVQKIEKTLEYVAKLSDIETENYYPNKNEEITLKFIGDVSYGASIKNITINNQEYNVEKVEGTIDEYCVKVNTGNSDGIKEYHFTEVTLDNDKKLKIDNTLKIDVLKEMPKVQNYIAEEDINNSMVNISFEVIDIDNSITTAQMEILNELGEMIQNEVITTGKNDIKVKVEDGKNYIVKFVLYYNLDTDQLEQEENHTGMVEIDKQLQFVIDYQWKIDNIATYKDKEKTTNFEKNESIQIGFESTNATKFEPAKVKIDGKEYSVTKRDNLYVATIDAKTEVGKREITLEEMILSNGKKFEINKDNKITVNIIKQKPTITDLSAEESIEEKKLKVRFSLNDEDKAIESATIILLDKEGNEIQRKDIQSGEVVEELDTKLTSSYNIKVIATYNQTGEEVIKDSILLDEVIKAKPVTNIRKVTIDKDYVEKGQDVTITYEIETNKEENITKIRVNNVEYLTEDISKEIYKVTLLAGQTSGIQELVTNKVIYEDNIIADVNNTIKIDVLKDKPKIADFSFVETDSNQIIASFNLIDKEEAMTDGTISIQDENGNKIKTEKVKSDKNEITFEKGKSEVYTIKVFVDYDLDTNQFETGKNEYQDENILEEVVVVNNRMIEMKDIENVYLYKQNGTTVDKVTNVNIADLNNLEDYLVKVEMQDLPEFYSKIKEYKVEEEILKFVLDYDNVAQYNGEAKHNYIEVEYGPVEGNVATQSDLETLIEQIKNNPSGNYKIINDLDASKILEGQAVILQEFSGTLNGNGHTIKNLSRPLFASLNGATIENLVIQNASVKAYGALAPTMSGATVRNVHLKDVTVTAPGANGTGSFAGIANSNTVIENCSATNVTVGTAKRTGGLIGKMNNTTVRNCYISGTVSSNSDGSGGLIGEALSGSIIENCYVNVKTNFSGTGGSIGGVIGNPENTLLKNTLSVATSISGDGHGARMFGRYIRDINGNSNNNYELATSNLNSNSSHKAVIVVEESTLRTKEFYKETLKWDENIWNFDNVEKGEYPTLKNADPNNNIEERPSNEKLFIPEYSRLKKLSNYDVTKEIAYHNLYKLMPFYDAKYLIQDGNKISSTDELNTKLIKAIVPLNSENQMIVGLTDKTKQNIEKIKIVFEDESTQEHMVTYEDTIGNIANYELKDLKIGYNYPKYLLKEDSKLVTTLINQIKGYTFEENLNEITSEDEDKRYKENFDNNVKENAREFVINLLANVPEYNISIESQMLENKINQDLEKNSQLKKLLVAYNYIDRMYKIDIGGVIVRDTLFFDGSAFGGKLNPIQATNQFLLSSYRATNQSVNYYNNSIKPYTKKASIADFLEYFIKNFAGYEDVTRWFPENYQGFVYEAPAKDFGTSVEYRAWNLMKRRQEIILATLTMPSDQMYVLSIPAQLLVGSIRIYKDDVDNPAEREEFKNWLKTYGDLLGEYYNTQLKYIPNGEKIITNKISIHYDKRATKGPIYQDPNTTDDPFVKHFYGMIKRQAALNGTAAYANGTDVYWVANTIFFNTGSGNTGTFTHESAHNQDGYFHLLGYGRRPGAGGECFTDSVVCQRMNIETIHFNAMYNHDFTAEIANNLTQERIDSTEKVEDFYKKMWETINSIDYIEAQAFLQCSPEVQSKIARKYVWGTSDPEAANITKAVTADEFKAMNLQTVQDLWDNQICIRVGATLNGDSLDNVYWYLPHNDTGVPEAKCFKRTAFEMLSVGGYKGGFVQYMSGASKNDLDAIRKITKDDTMTWEKYQMNKYQTVSEKINNSSYFNADEMIQMFKQVMEEDAQMGSSVANARRLRRYLYLYLQRATNDFRTGIYDEKQVVHISSGTQFVETIKKDPYGLYVLDADIDLTGMTGMTGNTSITDVNFVGELDGNGHTISGIEMPIFNMIKFSNIYDLKLDNISILGASGGGRTGALARTASYSNFKNIHIVSGKIEGTTYVGGMIGEISACFIKECTANANIQATANYAGGMIGIVRDSSITNSYTLGQVKGRQRTGGFIGSAGNSYIEKCYSNSTVESTYASSSGGFIGETFNNTNIKNNIAFGRTKNAYKFDGMSASGMFGANYQNNYEYEESVGTSTLNKAGIDFTGKITSVSTAAIGKQDFYKNNLKWDATIWDFTNVEAGGLPKLKNLDPNNVISAIEKTDISSADDFMKIQEAPDGIYNITADIDFSQIKSTDIKTGNADNRTGKCIINGIFTGKINGNGHTLANLTGATLFNDFRGTVTDLNISNFTNTGNEDYVSAFARVSTTATLSNMKFKNITLSGANGVAPVVGMDGRTGNSVFEKISVENANVTGSGVYVSTFIGRKYGGKIINCYVEGNLECYTTECGGLIGAFQNGGQISNVIANVNINRPRSTDNRNNNGGLIGNIYNSPSIQNSISIGNMTGFRDNSGKEINVFKFTGCTEANIIACFENCYELKEKAGTSSITANTGTHLKEATLNDIKNVSFYKDILHFDDTIWNFTNISKGGYPELK